MSKTQLTTCRFKGDDPGLYGIQIAERSSAASRTDVRASLLSDAVRITSDLIPELYRVLDAALSRLGVSHVVHGYVYNDPSIQAQCVHIGGTEKSAVMLSSGLVNLMADAEIAFVIGHELGHMLFDHHLYPRANDSSTDGERLNFLALQRAAEISSDRIGLIASGSIDAAFRAILKTGTGLSNVHLRFNLTAFLDQLRSLNELGGSATGIGASHPNLGARMKALLWFEMSDLGRELLGETNAGTPVSVIDERIERLLYNATGPLLDDMRTASFAGAAMWSILYAATVDRRLTKAEQQGIQNLFGKEAVDSAKRLIKEHGSEAVSISFEGAMRDIRFHPEPGRRQFVQDLTRDLGRSGVDAEHARRVLEIVRDRLSVDADSARISE